MKVVTWANCPWSSFPESFISPLCFSNVIEQNVVLSLNWGWAPRSTGHFLRTSIRQKYHICMHDPLYPCFQFWLCISAELLRFLYLFFSLCFLCVLFFFPSFWRVSTRFREEVVHGKKRIVPLLVPWGIFLMLSTTGDLHLFLCESCLFWGTSPFRGKSTFSHSWGNTRQLDKRWEGCKGPRNFFRETKASL